MKKRTITAYLLLLALVSYTQDPYYFSHYQVENGLSHNTVMCSIQDKQGFLWLGTKDGLNRFDGTSFKVFRHDEDDSSSIGNDYIRFLHSSKKGQIFVGTQRGLYEYRPHTESFSPISSSGTKSIKEIISDNKDNLWYIAEGDLVRLENGSGKTKVYSHEENFWATSFCITNDGSFWIASADGRLKRYDYKQDRFTSFDVFLQSVNTPWIEKIYPAENGKILIGTAAYGLLCYDPYTNKTREIVTKNNDGTGIFVRDILQYKKDEYWLATESGIFITNTQTNTLVNLKKDYHNPYALSDNAVYTLCKDYEGGIWAGTFFGGVNYYVEQHAIFQKYFPNYTKNAISGNAVREIVKDKLGNFWIGTEDASPSIKQGAVTFYLALQQAYSNTTEAKIILRPFHS
ncbi:MAG: hypothetical protein EON98_07485 [Chitinophagaceae bacterium]|nr:MAG: hypothetical protein EON98_07485 [Chitinophagaceae bacterium]